MDNPTACINTFSDQVVDQSWWTAEFKDYFNVTRVSILVDKLYGGAAAGLKVQIGDTECGTLGTSVTNGAWLDLNCQNWGIVGNYIKLSRASPIIVFCGLKVYGHYIGSPVLSAL